MLHDSQIKGTCCDFWEASITLCDIYKDFGHGSLDYSQAIGGIGQLQWDNTLQNRTCNCQYQNLNKDAHYSLELEKKTEFQLKQIIYISFGYSGNFTNCYNSKGIFI